MAALMRLVVSLPATSLMLMAGATVSTVRVVATDAGLVLPAASVCTASTRNCPWPKPLICRALKA